MDNQYNFLSKHQNLKILVCSSLYESALNCHIVDEIVSILNKNFNARFFTPDQVILLNNFNDFNLLLYIGSSISEIVPLNTISTMAKLSKIPSIFWATDDPYEFDARHRANSFDIYFSNDYNSASNFIEREHVYHLPLAACKTDLRKINPIISRKLGMFFCGYPYENRKQIILDLLAEKNFSHNDIVVMGPNWTIDDRLQILTNNTQHDAVIDLYTLSKFILNLGRTFDIANSQRKLVATTPGPRTFECALSGTPQIYFVNSLEVENYYKPDHEIILAENTEEAVDKYHWFINNPEKWLNLAKAAQVRTQNEHMYSHRIKFLLKKISDIGILAK